MIQVLHHLLLIRYGHVKPAELLIIRQQGRQLINAAYEECFIGSIYTFFPELFVEECGRE